MKFVKMLLLTICLSLSIIACGSGGDLGGNSVTDGGGSSGGNGVTDGGSNAGGGNSSAGTVNYGLIMGEVRDTAGTSIGGVTITANGKTISSNDQGFYSIENVSEADRVVVNFTKQGYAPTTRIINVRSGLSTYVNAVMGSHAQTQTFNSSAGVTISSGANASVTIGPNALVSTSGTPYSGTATVTLTTFDPTTEAGLNAFPGNFEGVQESGITVPVESYGFMDVTISDSSGEQLNLADGQTADLVYDIPAGLQTDAPTTIPLWYFNHTDGQWYEDGSATRNGNTYEGTVTHFTIWNVDVVRQGSAFVTGYVGCGGVPVECADVLVKGTNKGWSSGETCTDENGYFRIPVNPNRPARIRASKGGIDSEWIEFTTLGPNETTDIGTIELCGTPLVKMSLAWGADPRDLDAHLTYPDADGRAHIYYSNKTDINSDGTVIAKLNTDDTSGKGPEIISLYQLATDGIYRFSVHHYAGSNSLTGSEASINLVVDGLGIYQLKPPVGANIVKDAWIAYDLVVSNGAVRDVIVVNKVRNSVGSTDIDQFNP